LLESRDKSIIETDALDEQTVAEIDRLIRSRSAGLKAISRVSRPRQRLEDLFIDIVERARAKRLETAGAQHGGQTAAFLRGEEPTGDDLIESLTNSKDEPRQDEGARRAAAAAQAAKQAGPDENVLASLLETAAPRDAKPSAPVAKPGSTAAAAPPDVDLGVIGSLLDGDDPSKGKGKRS
jgi:hypothetical protein